MRSHRRRARRPDPLASTAAVRALLARLKAALPGVFPADEKKQVQMLRAARHVGRYAARDNNRGRRSKFDRSNLLKVGALLADILDRETSSRVAPASFIDYYLRLLDFPADVLGALEGGDINLFEAAQLARVTPARLSVSAAKARGVRLDLLDTHLRARLSGPRLRARVNEILSTAAPAPAPAAAPPPSAAAADLEEFEDLADPTHLFFDEIRVLGFSLREIKAEDLSGDDVAELLAACEPVMNVLQKFKTRKKKVKVIKGGF